MSQAKTGDKVKIHYTGSLKDGKIFDSSEGKEPLGFTIGEKMVIPGFENAVIGMTAGETKKVSIPPGDAYGDHQKNLVVVVERSQLPSNIDPKVGMILHAQTNDGRSSDVTITDITDESVTLDANHPIAGQELIFDLELIEIA
ncbi:MAG: peptidylprolyl isomerase [Nitrospinota bacterium]